MRRAITSTGLVVVLLMGGAAAAQEAPEAPMAVAEAAGEPVDTPPLSLEEMGDLNGRQGVTVDVLTTQQLTGTTSGNTVTAGTINSGDVSFSEGALDGFNGVGNFVINTGANNTLQGAINISVVTTPAS
jgi:hypothetical protein